MPFNSHAYYITSSTDRIIIDAMSAVGSWGARRFVTQFVNPVAPEDTVEITVSPELISGLSFTSDSNGLILSSVTETEVATGITYSEHLYSDEESKPVSMS